MSMRKKGLVVLLATIAILVLTLPAVLAAAKPVTLTVWAWDPITTTDPTAAYVRALVKNFEAKNPDIKIEWVALSNGLKDKVKIAMASNQGPDIFQSWGGSVMAEYAAAGRLLDLTKELGSVKTSAAARKAMSYNGHIYGIAPFFAIAGLYVNEGMFKRLGLKVPETVDELEKTADALKAKGIQPFAVGAKDKWPALATYMYLVNRYGGDAFTQAVARKIRFDAPPFVKAAQLMQDWANKGYFGEQPLGEAYGDAVLLMETGKAGMQVTGSWQCTDYSDKTRTDQTIGFYAFPTLKGGIGKATDVMGMTDIGFVATKLAAQKKDAIVRFFKYAMSPEAIAADPGRVSSVPDAKAPSRLTKMAGAVFAKAKYVQFWWDQDLPPALTTPVTDTIQSFLLPSTDVKAALAKFEGLAEQVLGPVK